MSVATGSRVRLWLLEPRGPRRLCGQAHWPGVAGVRPRRGLVRVALFTPQGGSTRRSKWPCSSPGELRRPRGGLGTVSQEWLGHKPIPEPEGLMHTRPLVLCRCAGAAREPCASGGSPRAHSSCILSLCWDSSLSAQGQRHIHSKIKQNHHITKLFKRNRGNVLNVFFIMSLISLELLTFKV